MLVPIGSKVKIINGFDGYNFETNTLDIIGQVGSVIGYSNSIPGSGDLIVDFNGVKKHVTRPNENPDLSTIEAIIITEEVISKPPITQEIKSNNPADYIGRKVKLHNTYYTDYDSRNFGNNRIFTIKEYTEQLGGYYNLVECSSHLPYTPFHISSQCDFVDDNGNVIPLDQLTVTKPITIDPNRKLQVGDLVEICDTPNVRYFNSETRDHYIGEQFILTELDNENGWLRKFNEGYEAILCENKYWINFKLGDLKLVTPNITSISSPDPIKKPFNYEVGQKVICISLEGRDDDDRYALQDCEIGSVYTISINDGSDHKPLKFKETENNYWYNKDQFIEYIEIPSITTAKIGDQVRCISDTIDGKDHCFGYTKDWFETDKIKIGDVYTIKFIDHTTDFKFKDYGYWHIKENFTLDITTPIEHLQKQLLLKIVSKDKIVAGSIVKCISSTASVKVGDIYEVDFVNNSGDRLKLKNCDYTENLYTYNFVLATDAEKLLLPEQTKKRNEIPVHNIPIQIPKGFKGEILSMIINEPWKIAEYKCTSANRKYYDKVINSILPYKIGYENECIGSLSRILYPNKSRTESKRLIISKLNCIDYSDDFENESEGFCEHRMCFNGHKQIMSLYNLCSLMSKHCTLNKKTGIHYHIDCPELKNEYTNRKLRDKLKEVLTPYLDPINEFMFYTGTYNEKKVENNKGYWINLRNDLGTVEFRISGPKFDYKEIVKELILLSKIMTEVRSKMGWNQYKISK